MTENGTFFRTKKSYFVVKIFKFSKLLLETFFKFSKLLLETFFLVANQKKICYNFNTATNGGLNNIFFEIDRVPQPPALNGSKMHHSLRSTFPRLHLLRLWTPWTKFMIFSRFFARLFLPNFLRIYI
jgi:hypothetical protein